MQMKIQTGCEDVPTCRFSRVGKEDNSPFCHAPSNLPSGWAMQRVSRWKPTVRGGAVRASDVVYMKIAERERERETRPRTMSPQWIGYVRSGFPLFFVLVGSD
jgi:hypothetical protein